MKISPSILAADLLDLKSILRGLDNRVDFIHLDVMDGHFVPQLSFGERVAELVKSHTDIPLDVHLMVDQPEIEVPKYYKLKPHNITFHIEATNFPVRLAREIRDQGIIPGIVLNPGTPVSRIEPIIDEIGLILIMSVEPGFYGQKFLELAYDKIRQARSLIGNRSIVIEGDGGINQSNIKSLAQAGVQMAVVGAACFGGPESPAERAGLLKKAASL